MTNKYKIMDKRLNPKTDRHMYKQSDFDYIAFGLRVKSERVLKGLRQEDLAKEIGCVRSTISAMERGIAVRLDFMLKVTAYFSINVLDYCTMT